MTTLNKTARQEVLSKVLREAFKPKFSDLQKRLVQYALDWRRTSHPVFEELLARKDAREYLQTKHFWSVYLGGMRCYFPEYTTYLPAPVVKQLPAVVPAESRAKLSALGIPASV